jgi:hypothetical protein
VGERVGFVWVAYLLFPAVLGALSAFKPSSKLPRRSPYDRFIEALDQQRRG